MSEKTNAYKDQAEQLKQIFDELQQNAPDSEQLSNELDVDDRSIPKIDVLNLPPRKEIHRDNDVRTRLSISGPFVRFLSIIILIIIIVFGAYFLWGDELILIINGLK